jgi:dolichol-phosphate mannosyltransferase
MKISVIIPTYNEEEVILLTLQTLYSVLFELRKKDLCKSFDILVIDDGSTDHTILEVEKYTNQLSSKLKSEKSPISILPLGKNQGQMKALELGLSMADGDVIFTLDADLQDPPELMEEMLRIHLETGIQCVQAVRRSRKFDSLDKRLGALIYYKLAKVLCDSRIIEQAGDFRLFAKTEAKLIADYPSEIKAIRHLIPILGIPTETIEFDRQDRAAGESKYGTRKLMFIAIKSIYTFNRFRKAVNPAKISGKNKSGINLKGSRYRVSV